MSTNSNGTSASSTSKPATKKPDLPPGLKSSSGSSNKVKMGGDDGTSWELVYKRNKVERLKHEKDPLDVVDELPEFIDRGYESIPEDDIVRLYWHGIVHDKPKIGKFMIRLKVPCGITTPDQLRSVGKISEQYGDNYSELTTRMGIQLHEVELDHLPDVIEAIQDTGLTNTGAEGDTVRNVTGCPLTGINPEETFDVRPLIDEVHEFFTGNPDYSDLPRKLKYTITACPLQCSGPEFHGIALLAVVKDGREGFAVKIGGGLASTPRMARDLGIFVPKDQAMDVLRGITNLWNEDLQYRLSRPKSRIKFMVDDYGPPEMREMLEDRLDRTFEEYEAPEPEPGDQSHLGALPQKQDGLYALGYSVPQGWVMGDQLQRIADVLDEVEGHSRFTRDQNFILADIPKDEVRWVRDQVDDIGFSLEQNQVFGHSVACTSHQYCNYSVAETKEKAQEILEELDRQFGDEIEDGLTVKMDGCPNACGQHWMANIGLQGTTARSPEGDKVQAYDVTLRGGTGTESSIGKALLRKIPEDEITETVVRLVDAWIEEREQRRETGDLPPVESSHGKTDFSFYQFCEEHTDHELKAIALDEEPEEVEQTQVVLRFTGPLVDLAGGIECHEFRARRTRTVGALLKSVSRRYKSLKKEIPFGDGDWAEHVNLFLNEEDIREMDGLETEVEAGDEVLALPALSGG